MKQLGILKSMYVLLLIVGFLWLSYCPVREAIQDVIKGSHQTEQTNAVDGLKPVSQICMDVVNTSFNHLTSPLAKIIDVLAVVFITLFILFPFINSRLKFIYYQPPLYTVPIYITNSVLLI